MNYEVVNKKRKTQVTKEVEENCTIDQQFFLLSTAELTLSSNPIPRKLSSNFVICLWQVARFIIKYI